MCWALLSPTVKVFSFGVWGVEALRGLLFLIVPEPEIELDGIEVQFGITSVRSLNLALHLLFCQCVGDPARNTVAAFRICDSLVCVVGSWDLLQSG